MFSCEYCEIFKNSFFYRTPLVAVSVNYSAQKMIEENENKKTGQIIISKNIYVFQKNSGKTKIKQNLGNMTSVITLTQ